MRWTSKSGAKLAEALREMGHEVVERTVLRILKAKGYSLQANKKTREGASYPDRDRQFEHINQTVKAAIAQGEPVISVDTKKRKLVGDYKAVGREFEPKGRPVEVRTHDFKDKQLGFKGSSQHHLDERSCDGSSASEVRSSRSNAVVVAGASVGGVSRAAPAVLGGDRSRCVHRGCGGRGGSVRGGWRPVVSRQWRDAYCHSGPAVGALPVIR